MEFGFILLFYSVVSIPCYFTIMAILNLQFNVDFVRSITAIGSFFLYIYSINYIRLNTYAVENVRYKTRYEFLKSNDTWYKIFICLLTGVITTFFSYFIFLSFIDGLTNFQINCIWTNFLVISLVFTGYGLFILENYVIKFPDIQENKFQQLYNSLDVLSFKKCLKLFGPFSFFHLFHAICFYPLIWHVFSYLSILNNLPNFILNMLGRQQTNIDNESGFVLNEYLNWYFLSLLFTSSSFLIYSLIVSQKICNILISQPTELMLSLNNENTIPDVLRRKNNPIYNYKAWLQFFIISKYDQKTRKFFYLLSHPGKHPKNWNTILEISFNEIKFLIETFKIVVEEKTDEAIHKNKVHLDAGHKNFRHINPGMINPQNNQPNLHLYPKFNSSNQRLNHINGSGFLFSNNQNTPTNNFHNMSPILTSTPVERNQRSNERKNLVQRNIGNGDECNPKKLWDIEGNKLEWDQWILHLNSVKSRLTLGERFQLEFWNLKLYVTKKINDACISISQRLKNIWLYTYLFDKLENYYTKLIFSNTQKYYWIIDGLTNLVCSSLDEDIYGVVQFTLVDIIELYFELLSALESWQNVSKRHLIFGDRTMAKQEAFFTSYLNSSIRRISFTFKHSLLSLNFKPEVINKLKPLVVGNY